MNLRELNYILIPKSGFSVERWEASRAGRLLRPFVEVFASATSEGQGLFVAMLVTGAAGVDVKYSHLYLVFSGLFGLLVAALLLRPMAAIRPGELRVGVSHPPAVVSGEALTVTIELENTGTRPLHALRISGPFLPWDGQWDGARPAIAALAPGETARLQTRVRFLVRGARHLDPFGVASIRPLGLARGNRRPTPTLRFTVLPREVPVLSMPLPPWQVTAPSASFSRLQRVGDGEELLGVRPYRAGDRLRDLHARAWARHGEPIVREMRAERRRRALVLVDVTGGERRETVDAALGLAMGVTTYLVRQHVDVELVGLGRHPLAVPVGETGAGLALAFERLAQLDAGPAVDPALAPATVATRLRVGAAHVIRAVGGQGEGPSLTDMLAMHVPAVRTYAVRRAPRGPMPVADVVFDEATLAAPGGVVL